MKKQNGFSLIELLIVVAIILIIAAIAIPNLLRSRIAANEASAVRSLRAVDTAQVTYASTYPSAGYATNLATLGPGSNAGNTSATSTNAVLLDNILGCATATASGSSCTKSGYIITMSGGTAINGAVYTYAINADPVTQDQTGTRHFYTGTPGYIQYNLTAGATSMDQPLQ
jgi:prepilin-type N-terminal cleavage/methylation domain-containing protein